MTAEREGLAEIAGVLAEHSGCTVNDGEISAADTAVDVWSCGLRVPYEEDFGDAERAHYAHALADLLAARDRRVRAEAVESVAQAIEVIAPAAPHTITPKTAGAQATRSALLLAARTARAEADA